MIGEDRMQSRAPLFPRNTGHVPTLQHAATALVSSSGGSSKDTNSPSRTCRIVWVETNECRSSLLLISERLATSTLTRKAESAHREKRTPTLPLMPFRPPYVMVTILVFIAEVFIGIIHSSI